MTQLHPGKFVDWGEGVRFLSSCFSIYGILNGKLELADTDDFLAFYARPFLSSNQWSVIPLWEGDLRELGMENNDKLVLMSALRNRCLAKNAHYLYRATIERAKAPYELVNLDQKETSDAAITIAIRKIDLHVTDPCRLFEPTNATVPYWGHSFLWPSDERFVVYTNGDNVAFIAGNRNEIEELLGVPYEYCMERFISANARHPGWSSLINSYKIFCDEFCCAAAPFAAPSTCPTPDDPTVTP